MAISTNGTVLARVAGALYNTQMSNATYSEVKTLDPASLTDALYARDFANATDAAVATTLVTNLGLSSVAGLVNWVAAQLTAAGSHKGAKIVDLLNGFAQMTTDATYGAYATAFNAKVDAALVLSQTTGNAGGVFEAAGTAGQTFTLTTGVDALTGTAGNDIFNAGTADSLTTFDILTGGAGTDTINANITGTAIPVVGVTVSGIETANIVSTAAELTANVSNWTGLTTLNLTNLGIGANDAASLSVTAAVTTAATVTASTFIGDVTLTGGTNAAVSATAADDMLLTGVKGSATATGGAEATDILSINANAALTAVTVLDGGVVAIGDGLTTLADVTFNDDAVTDTITTVSITGNAGASTINSDVLTSLTLADSAQNSTITAEAATRTLGLTINKLTGGTISDATATTLNITSTGTATTGVTVQAGAATGVTLSAGVATTLAALTAGVATTVGISGAAATVITADTLAAAAVITSTSTGGVTLTQELLAGQRYVGTDSTGADVIGVAASTVAHTTGAGNDTVAISAVMGTGGSVDAGDGADVLSLTAANAITLSANVDFDAGFSNFERLTIGDVAAGGTVALAGLDDINYVTLGADVDAGQTLAITGAADGLTLVANSGSAGTITAALTTPAGTADDINVNISAGAAQTAFAITATAFENINFVLADSDTTTSDAVHVVTTLTAAAAKAVVVTGDAGLTLGTFSATTVTSFDASAVTGSASNVSWTSGALAAASTIMGGAGADSLSAASAVAAVTLQGNGGNDALTGSSTIGSSIDGGAGNDTITGGAAADTVIGGDGTDTFVLNLAEQAGASTTDGAVVNLSDAALTQAGVFTVTGKYLTTTAPSVSAGTATYLFSSESSTNASIVDTVSGIENVTGTTGADYIVGSAAANVIRAGNGIDFITGGSGADTFVMAAALAANADNITDFVAGTAGDVLSFDISDIGLNAADYAAGAVTIITKAAFEALGAGAAANHIIVDTAANIALVADAGTAATGGLVAIATDTGAIYFDANGDFTSTAAVIVGSITAAQAALLVAGNLSIQG